MMKTKTIFLILLVISLPLSANSRQEFFQVDLFHQGENGVNTYRIPAMLETAKHTLIAVVDARHDNSNDMPNQISLVMRRSLDGGSTWSPMRTIVAVQQGGVGDTSLLFDRTTGLVWCFFSYGPPGIGFHTAQPGASTGPTTFQIHAMHSDDDGTTWSDAVDITPQIKDPAWQAMFAASGTDIQLKNGRLLVPLVIRDGNGVIHSANAYSDDHGTTWKHGDFIGDHTDESHNVELDNAAVLQNMRDSSTHTRAIARSTDGGVTFGPVTHDAALIDPVCNAGITHYHLGKKDALVFTNAASSRRENLTVKVSYDQGNTWPLQRTIYPGPAAYSTVVQLHDGSIGVLYEHGTSSPYETISFARFNVAWMAQHP